MSKIDCNNMDERHVCKLDECTCGYTKGKCEDMTCKDYVSNEKLKLEELESILKGLDDSKFNRVCSGITFNLLGCFDADSSNLVSIDDFLKMLSRNIDHYGK